MSVQSALGQPLRAEVEVTSVTPEEVATLSARLASPDAFRAAGLQFNNALAGITMAVEERNGRHFIRVSSPAAINEPFVDLMVELNWASGKFVREYTFLLDPPELRASRQTVEAGGPGVAPVAPAASSLATPSAAAPAASAASAPVPGARAASAVAAAPVAAPSAAAPAAAPARAVTPAVSSDAPGSVTVQRGDTLGRIAANVRPANATLEQTIVAIYQANRSAFIENNPNLVRQGRTLSIPDAASIAAVDPTDARRQLRVASRDFRAYKDRIAGAAPQVEAATASASASGTVSGRVEDSASRATSSDRLELSRSSSVGADGQAGGVGSREAENQVAREAALSEANSRVAELEKTVADLQRMLELRSRSMADLQAQLDKARTSGAAVSGSLGPAAGASTVTEPAATPATPTPAEPMADLSGAPAGSSQTPAGESASSAAESSPPATVATPPVAEVAPPATVAPATPARPPVAVAPQPEPSFTDGLLANPMTMPVVGGLGLLAILGAWMVMRRRRKVENFEDSLAAADAFTANSLFGTTGGQSVDTTTGVTSTQITTMSESSPTEVDPIAEADVYIAYGREAQAEEILKEALKRQPERQAIRLKLMEIYAGRKDAQAFELMAREMHGATDGQNEEWPKVVAMGLAIDPANSLYAGSQAGSPGANSSFSQAAAVTSAAAASAAAFDTMSSRGPDSVIGQAAVDAADLDSPATVTSGDLDFNLDPARSIDTRTADDQAEFGPSMAFESSTTGPLSAMPTVDLPSLDLDAPTPGHSASRSASHSAAAVAEAETVNALNIDVDSLETLTGRATEAGPQTQSVADDLDLSAIGLDLSPSTVSGPTTITGAGNTQWQEMASKLDLASAYGEIGDKEGARELLQEVVRGGDPAQQQRARELLASI